MSGISRFFVVFAVAGGVWAAAACAEPPLQLAPQEGALLLRNGQVILGKIIPAGDHYIVSVPHGEIRRPTSEVDLFCKDLEEVYQRKRARIELGKAADHVDLADWCLKNELLDHADTQLSYALAADVNYPRIRLLERRLQLARRDTEPHPAHHKAAEHGPTNDELDRFIRGMPSSAINSFTSTIQPLLVNNCTTSGCHGPQSEAKLQLLRIPPGSPPTRRTTQRNLYAVWQQINASDPATSPLLVVATQQHGNSKAATFTDHDAVQYRQLVAWVNQIARGRKASQPATVNTPSAPLLQTIPPNTPARQVPDSNNGGNGDPPPQSTAKPGPRPAEKTLDSLGEGGELELAPADASVLKEASDKEDRKPLPADYVPVDPFDPEIFNRQFHKD